MSTSDSFFPQTQAPPPTGLPPEPAEPGIRSSQGIRWLLLIGASVVVVSLIRLVAGQWRLLPESIQFLLLCLGSLGVYGAGELCLTRLRLPAASSALFGLFSVSVPVLSWGAARQGLVHQPLGFAIFVLACGAWGLVAKRLLATVYDYDDRRLPAYLALFVGALPIAAWGVLPSFGIAAVLGLVLIAACRHVNRFFFHRDRIQGVDRPVDALPFVSLLGLYLANVLIVGSSGAGQWALALAFVALALADAGEEYYRALTRALGRAMEVWPKRSVGLLTAGFALGAVATGLAFLAGDPLALTVVTGLMSAYLIAWSFRYGRATSYAVALPLGLVSLHSSPAVLTGLRDRFIQLASNYFGYGGLKGTLSAAAGGELMLLTALVAGAALLHRPNIRRRTTPAMVHVHAWAVAALGCWTLAITSVGTAVTAQIAPIATIVLLIATRLLKHPAPLLPAHFGALLSTYAFFDLAGVAKDVNLSWLVVLNLLLSAAVWIWTGRHTGTGDKSATGSVSPVLFLGPTLAAVGLFGLKLSMFPLGLAGGHWLGWCAVWTTVPFLLAGLRLERAWLTVAAAPAWVFALQLAVAEDLFVSDNIAGWIGFNVCLIAAFWLLGGWTALRRTSDSRAWRSLWKSGGATAFIFGLLGAAGDILWTSSWSLATALFFAVSGLAWTELCLRGYIHRPRSGTAGLLLLGLTPGLLLGALWPIAQPATAQIALAVGTLWLLRRLSRNPRFVYGLERLYRHLTLPAPSERLAPFADQALTFGCRLGVAFALVWTGPWTTLLLAAIWLTTNGRSRAGAPWLGLLWIAHGTLSTAGQSLLAEALVNVQPDAVARLPAGLGLWLFVHRGETSAPVRRVALVLEPAAMALAVAFFPMGWTGAMVIGLAIAYATARGIEAWRHDRVAGAWLAQGWTMATALVVDRWTAFEIPGLALSAVLLAGAFAGRFLGDALRSRQRPGLANTLVASSALWAVAGAWVGYLASSPIAVGPAIPLFLASLFFALQIFRRVDRGKVDRGKHWIYSAGAAVCFFVAGSFDLVNRLEALQGEAYLVGPGFALIGLSAAIERRIGSTWSRYLLTAGAGCLYAVPMLTMMRELNWGSQILLLVMSVAFGALSFHLRSRSLLIVSTGAALTSLGFFLFMISKTPVLLWLSGLAFGLALMALAAYLESRREMALQQARLWTRELKSWT